MEAEGGQMFVLGKSKGQGATEYLVLLAVVLIVAMVAIALLGFFPGLTGESREDQSRIYWSGVAKPFQITEASQGTSPASSGFGYTDSTYRILKFKITNGGASTLIVQSIIFNGTLFNMSYPSPMGHTNVMSSTLRSRSRGVPPNSVLPMTLLPGQSEVLGFISDAGNVCVPGSSVVYKLSIIYDTEEITGISQVGAKDMVLSCG